MSNSKLSLPQMKALAKIAEATDTPSLVKEFECHHATAQALIDRRLVERVDIWFLRVTETGRLAMTQPKITKRKREARKIPWSIYHEPDIQEIDDGFCSARPSASYQVEAGSITGDALLYAAWNNGQ